ncbi:hypothetical protein RJ640_017326 [Escallonia rubra]|uniref:ARM repeat superfamily protein n=1 Tax=Escallonia rubra TaxID=112253 RepID=A0AA88UD93_9ASTE|nr:hypothetical protein RJ640_017326 [Escallonia rubra]
MGNSSTWFVVYTKFKFFTRIQRLLQLQKKPSRRYKPSDFSDMAKVTDMKEEEEEEKQEVHDDCEGDWVVLQRAVKRLHFGSWEEKEKAAEEIKRVCGGDLKRRKSVAELGVIPPLVAMVGEEVVARQRLAVQTLLELAIGSYTNKGLMVEAGILSKLPEKVDALGESSRHELAQLVLSISSLANSQFPFTSTKILPFVLSILESDSTVDTKELCLGTLYNLSTMLDTAGSLVTNGVVDTLLRMSSLKETSEKALATLGNLVVTLVGKKDLENNPMVPESLIEILTWEERPKCQELSAYILMILGHQSSMQRMKMAKAGIVPVLLEVALLGSPLAQKRALRLLQWFKDERQVRMGAHSGPQTGRLSIGSPVNHEEAYEGKKLMKKMVKQSLYKNLETITRRANGADDDPNSKLKLLVISSSSKSLPY